MRRRAFLLALTPQPRPNVVFILVDDLRFDELSCTGHPFAQTPAAARLAREGANFQNAFASTPLCSPSRAAFLTGDYSHSNGITDNVARNALSHKLTTWPRLLHDAGYRTAFLGKWHMGNDDSPRPGFNKWVSFRGQGECFNPPLNIDGSLSQSTGYVTDILTQHALDFLNEQSAKPFCLYLSHKAIHPNIVQNDDGSIDPTSADNAASFLPAPRHEKLYAGLTPPRRKNYLQPPTNKPALQNNPPGTAPLSKQTATGDDVILNRMRMMKAVDECTAAILDKLQEKGVLDNTIVIFTSDHGYFYGEHCLGPERRLAYEEAIRIPLLLRYPAKFRPGAKPANFVLSIDVAPTVLALANVPVPKAIQGRPLWATLHRDAVLIEYFSDSVFPRIKNMGYRAVRTKRWKYIHYLDTPNADELYDLQKDPYELDNLISRPGTPLPELKARLNKLLAETNATP